MASGSRENRYQSRILDAMDTEPVRLNAAFSISAPAIRQLVIAV